jgi:5-methylthioribose kinase
MTLGTAEIGARAAACAPAIRLRGPWERLGGLVNVVHRVGAEPLGSVIVKHAPPHVASAPEIPLSPARLAFEHSALCALAPGGALGGAFGMRVRVPRVLGADLASAVLVLEDFGALPDLATALAARPSLAGSLHGLGEALAGLHVRSAGRAHLAAVFDNADVQATRLRVQYEPVGRWLAEADVADASALGARAAALGRALRAPGRCLTMGDLWPASVLASGGDLCLIDWEFAHYGRPLQDVAHLAAHLWMHEQRAQESEAANAFERARREFLLGYATAAPDLFDAAELADAAVHAGCEILARTLGPFRAGFLYDGLPPGEPALAGAVAQAAAQLRAPADGGVLAPLAVALAAATG